MRLSQNEEKRMKLREEKFNLERNLEQVEDKIKSRDQSPKHIVRNKKKKLKEALDQAEYLR